MAAMAPPDMPFDEPDDAPELDAALLEEGVAVAGTVLLLLLVVVGADVGNEITGVDEAAVVDASDPVEVGVSDVIELSPGSVVDCESSVEAEV